MITSIQDITLQAEDQFDIEPNDRYNFVGDTTNNPKGYPHAAIYVNRGGNIALIMDGGASKVYENVPDHWVFPGKVVRVNASQTTATGIVGWVQKSKA